MNKKLFTGLLCILMFSGIATAQTIEYNDFEENLGAFEGGDVYRTNILEQNNTYQNDNERFYHIYSRWGVNTVLDRNDQYALDKFESENDTVADNLGIIKPNRIKFDWTAPHHIDIQNTSSEGVFQLRDSKGDLIFSLKSDENYGDNRGFYIRHKSYDSNSYDLLPLYVVWDGGDIESYAPVSEIIEVDIKFNRNQTYNWSLTGSYSSLDYSESYVEYESESNEIDEIRLKNSTVIDNLFISSESPDFSITFPIPEIVKEKGFPFGTLILINIIVGFLSLLYALVPDQVFEGFEAFQTYIGGIIASATTTLSLATEYIKWIQTVGIQRLKDIALVFGIIVVVRYGSVIKEGIDGQRSLIGSFEFIVNDLISKAESIERIMYRAMDTITNITHLGFYLFEQVIKIYRTIKNHIPLIG